MKAHERQRVSPKLLLSLFHVGAPSHRLEKAKQELLAEHSHTFKALSEMVQSGDPYTQLTAIRAMSELNLRNRKLLRSMLRSTNAEVASAAAFTLAQNREGFADLKRVFLKPNFSSETRVVCAEALGYFDELGGEVLAKAITQRLLYRFDDSLLAASLIALAASICWEEVSRKNPCAGRTGRKKPEAPHNSKIKIVPSPRSKVLWKKFTFFCKRYISDPSPRVRLAATLGVSRAKGKLVLESLYENATDGDPGSAEIKIQALTYLEEHRRMRGESFSADELRFCLNALDSSGITRDLARELLFNLKQDSQNAKSISGLLPNVKSAQARALAISTISFSGFCAAPDIERMYFRMLWDEADSVRAEVLRSLLPLVRTRPNYYLGKLNRAISERHRVSAQAVLLWQGLQEMLAPISVN